MIFLSFFLSTCRRSLHMFWYIWCFLSKLRPSRSRERISCFSLSVSGLWRSEAERVSPHYRSPALRPPVGKRACAACCLNAGASHCAQRINRQTLHLWRAGAVRGPDARDAKDEQQARVSAAALIITPSHTSHTPPCCICITHQAYRRFWLDPHLTSDLRPGITTTWDDDSYSTETF